MPPQSKEAKLLMVRTKKPDKKNIVWPRQIKEMSLACEEIRDEIEKAQHAIDFFKKIRKDTSFPMNYRRGLVSKQMVYVEEKESLKAELFYIDEELTRILTTYHNDYVENVVNNKVVATFN